VTQEPDGPTLGAGEGPDDDAALHHRIEQDQQDYMRPEWLERWRLRIARNKPLEAAYRVFVLVIGVAIVLAGIAMLIFPGPGWAAIILGLLVLATEYRWAERLLDPVQRFVRWLARRAKDPAARAENIAFAVIVLAIIALALWWYLARYGVTLEPLPFFN